jgi:acylphosphatase
MRRCHVVVRGRVQGVGFRWFVRERARRLGLSGEIWNRADGGVEVEAEGDERGIEKLLTLLRTGPDGAKVTDLEELATASPDGILPNPFAVKR